VLETVRSGEVGVVRAGDGGVCAGDICVHAGDGGVRAGNFGVRAGEVCLFHPIAIEKS